jgi:hypothetical protein
MTDAILHIGINQLTPHITFDEDNLINPFVALFALEDISFFKIASLVAKGSIKKKLDKRVMRFRSLKQMATKSGLEIKKLDSSLRLFNFISVESAEKSNDRMISCRLYGKHGIEILVLPALLPHRFMERDKDELKSLVSVLKKMDKISFDFMDA